MVLKQQPKNGNAHFIDLGNEFILIDDESQKEEFDKAAGTCFGEHVKDYIKDVHGFVVYGKGSQIEPLYLNRFYWIYSNDGQLFLSLTFK